jgi:hypothetical protein
MSRANGAEPAEVRAQRIEPGAPARGRAGGFAGAKAPELACIRNELPAAFAKIGGEHRVASECRRRVLEELDRSALELLVRQADHGEPAACVLRKLTVHFAAQALLASRELPTNKRADDAWSGILAASHTNVNCRSCARTELPKSTQAARRQRTNVAASFQNVTQRGQYVDKCNLTPPTMRAR